MLVQFKEKFEDQELYILSKTFQLYKDKKYFEAEQLLKEFSNTSNSKITNYYLLQILLIQEKYNESINLIKTLDDFIANKIGLVSGLITILKKQNSKNEITNLFTNIINYLSKSNPSSKELEIFIKENSNYQIECGNFQQACEMLEKMRSFRTNDFKILSKLINIYSKFDTEKANRF